MGFKVPTVNIPNPIIRVLQEKLNFSIEDLISSKASLYARVLERSTANNEYLLNFSGKQLKLYSEARLLVGEDLQLKVNRQGSQILLEIINRSSSSQQASLDLDTSKIWSKAYYSPIKTVVSMLESNSGEVSLQKIHQFLDVFFPGIEWNANVSQFEWKFEDGGANGFYGKRKDSFGFYFHFESKKLGLVDTYLNWKKEDLSDIVLHSVFNQISTYLLANENLLDFKKMLSSNSIFPNNIIFHYSSIKREKGDWVA